MEQMFPDKSIDERLSMLEANAYIVDEDLVRRNFSEFELEKMRVEFASESIILGDLEEQKSVLVKDLNLQIKEKKGEVKPLLKKIRKGYSEQKETVFGFDDQTLATMNFYDGNGDFLFSRPLKPSERQTKIHNLQKAM